MRKKKKHKWKHLNTKLDQQESPNQFTSENGILCLEGGEDYLFFLQVTTVIR